MRQLSIVAWTLAALACGVTATSRAHADDEDELHELLGESVVSGASKSDEVASDAPATTMTITAAEMARYGIRSLDEAINFLGTSLVTQNPLHSVEVGGRGVLLTSDFGNHVLLVVDGHVLNEPWNGTAYFEQGAAIPFELIDHIELIVGPGSVLYGGSAMFGVINVVTKRARELGGARLVAEGSASPRQGANGELTSFAPADVGGAMRLGAALGREMTLFGKNAELVVGTELYHQDGPSFAWANQPVTGSDGSPANFGPRSPLGIWGGRTTHQYRTTVPSLYAKFLLGDLVVAARAATYTRSTPYINRFNQYFSDFDDPQSYERDRWVSLDAQHRARFGSLSTLVRAYGDVYDYQQRMHATDGSSCDPVVAGPCTARVHGESQWVGAELQARYDWRDDDTLTTMLGADTKLRHVGGQTDTLDDASSLVGTAGRKYVSELVTSVYGQQRWSPASYLHLNGGARFDADPRGGNRVSPRAAVSANTWRGGVVKTIYSEAFRAPSFYEAFYEAPGQTAPKNISAEVVRSAEASVEQAVGKHRFSIGVFRTWWRGMITLVAVDDETTQFRNLDAIDNWGFTANAHGAFGEVRYGLSLTEAHSDRLRPEGETPVPVAPQVFGNARLSYDLPAALPTVALAASFVQKRAADRALDGNFATVPYAPASVNLRATLSEKVPGVSKLSYRLAVDYVTAAKNPYVAGPIQVVEPNAAVRPNAQLAPINRFTAFVTLQYELPL